MAAARSTRTQAVAVATVFTSEEPESALTAATLP
jgi:hypothetical protein